MRYVKSRKYPITHMKQNSEPERYLDVGVMTAVGLLAFMFANGLLLGYLIKKRAD